MWKKGMDLLPGPKETWPRQECSFVKPIPCLAKKLTKRIATIIILVIMTIMTRLNILEKKYANGICSKCKKPSF